LPAQVSDARMLQCKPSRGSGFLSARVASTQLKHKILNILYWFLQLTSNQSCWRLAFIKDLQQDQNVGKNISKMVSAGASTQGALQIQ
jgi:hypothetical protein